MKVELFKYDNSKVTVNIPDDIYERKAAVIIDVVYGDELIYVDYLDGEGKMLAGRADCPCLLFEDRHGFDGSYIVVHPYGKDKKDLLHDEAWLNRKDSYAWFEYLIDSK